MKIRSAVLPALALGLGAALVPVAAQAQEIPSSCQNGTFRQMAECTARYGKAHPSHDAYFYGPMHFRGRSGETIHLVGGMAGDVYELQYCRAGSWSTITSAKVGSDTEVALPMEFASIPKDANAVRARNMSVGVTSTVVKLTDYYDFYFTGASAACSANAGTGKKPAPAPTTKPGAKEHTGGLAGTGV